MAIKINNDGSTVIEVYAVLQNGAHAYKDAPDPVRTDEFAEATDIEPGCAATVCLAPGQTLVVKARDA